MYAGKLDVFRNGIFHDFSVLSYCVELHLVSFRHELAHDNRIFLADLACHLKEACQLFIRVANVHSSTRKDIRRTHQNGITHFVDELLHVLHACQGTPSRLVNAKLIEHGGELAAVLGTVNADGRCTENGHALSVELHREVVWYLSTCGNNDTAR